MQENALAQGRYEQALSIQQVEAMLATAGLAPPAIAEQGRRLNHIGAEMAMLEERWLELNEQLEQMQAGARG